MRIFLSIVAFGMLSGCGELTNKYLELSGEKSSSVAFQAGYKFEHLNGSPILVSGHKKCPSTKGLFDWSSDEKPRTDCLVIAKDQKEALVTLAFAGERPREVLLTVLRPMGNTFDAFSLQIK